MSQLATARTGAGVRYEPWQIAAATLQAEDALLAVVHTEQAAWAAYYATRTPPPGLHRSEHASWALQRIPADADLAALADNLGRAVAARPDDRQNRLLVSLLFDSIASGRPADPAVPIEVLLHDLRDDGYPPTVVAVALRGLRRTQKFPPAISEVLAACGVARDRLHKSLAAIDRVRNARADFVETVRLAGRSNPPSALSGAPNRPVAGIQPKEDDQ